MKTNYIYTSFLFLCALFIYPVTTLAQEAEFVTLSKKYILKQDGSQEFRCSKELKIFTHTAMNSTYGETFIVYNPEFQELKIHTCYTKQKDGTIIKTPENAFIEVLPRFAANAPAFNGLKEMVVVHTGLDLGATIYLDYSILTKANYYPELDIDEFLEETSPIRDYQYSISVPEGKALNKQLNVANKAVEQIANGIKTYSWRFKNIPASSRMPFLPQNKEDVLRITANSFSDNLSSFNFISKQINGLMAMESETYAQFITESTTSVQEKINLIHSYVVKNINTIPIPLQYTGYRLRSADEVIRSAYGTELEKTNLLYKMLEAAEVPSEIVLIYPSKTVASINGLAGLKQFAVKTTVDSKAAFLSPSNISPLTPEFRGGLDNLFALNGNKIEINQRPAIFDESKEITLPVEQAKNGYLIYTLPQTNGFDKWNITSLNSKRSDILELPSMIQDKITYAITIPEGWEFVGTTEPTAINNNQGKLNRSLSLNGNKLEVVRSIELNQIQFNSGEYNDLRTLISEWNSDKNKQLVFKIK